MDKSGIYARDSLSPISLILSYISKIPDFREYYIRSNWWKEQERHDVMNMTLNEVHQTGRERVRDRERPGPSENQAITMTASFHLLLLTTSLCSINSTLANSSGKKETFEVMLYHCYCNPRIKTKKKIQKNAKRIGREVTSVKR